MHAQEAASPMPLLCTDQRDYLGLDLSAGQSFGPVFGFLVEGGDRGEPVIFACIVEIGGILTEPAQCLAAGVDQPMLTTSRRCATARC